MKNVHSIVLKILGILLLTAAILKGWQLLTEPLANKDIWSYRPILIFTVEFELALALWLLSGLFKKAAWLTSLAVFSVFSLITLYKGLSGADSCGCFGAVKVNPWLILFAIDLPAVIALLIFRPVVMPSSSRHLQNSGDEVAHLAFNQHPASSIQQPKANFKLCTFNLKLSQAAYLVTLVIVLCQLLYSPLIVSAEENTGDTYKKNMGEVNYLYGKELENAQREINQTDKKRAEFERQYIWTSSKDGDVDSTPTSLSARREFEEIEQAYKNVIKKYPQTEIAAYSGLRLSGFYNYRNEHLRAIEQAKEVAIQFRGTALENNANFTVALLYLQAKNDPYEASNWFKKIPKPSNLNKVDSQNYNEAEKLYLSSQQQMAKCEFQMTKTAYSKRRYERLTERYPQFKTELENNQRTESIADIEHQMGFDVIAIRDEVIHPGPVFAEEVSTGVPVGQIPTKVKLVAKDQGTNSGLLKPQDHSKIKEVAKVKNSNILQAKLPICYLWLGLLSLVVGIFLSLFGILKYFVYRLRAGKEKNYV